jgi:PAS domain S-box-containing protein
MEKRGREEGHSFGSGAFEKPDDLALHLLHSLDKPICLVDEEDCFLFANKAFASLYSVGPETMRGWPIRELIGEAFYDKRIRTLLERARKDGSSEFRGSIDYPEIGRRFIEADIRLYSHPSLVGKNCLLLQCRDITDREELDQRRRKSLSFQEGLLEKVPAMVWIAGKDGVPYYYNESWLNFTGNTLVEQIREGWLGQVHPDDRQMVMDRIHYAQGNRDEVHMEFRLRYLLGGYRWVRLQGKPIEAAGSSNADFIISVLDIDDSRSRQEQMRTELLEERHLREQALLQKAAADRANREKSAYLSLASHEIRTPMNPVIGFADLLASNPNLDGDSKEMAQMILKAGKNLLTLLDEVLDFAKIEAGVLQLSPEPTDVHDLLIEIDNLFSYDAKSRGIELRISDRVQGESELFQDRLRLQQVLGTLVTNAIKFTHTGHVEVEAGTEDVHLNGSDVRMLTLTVRDTGVGMNEDDVGKLFQPFARGESEFSDKYAGTGLGLAIAQKLIDAMRGTVKVESTVGKGTTIELTLPMTPVPEHLKRTRKSVSASVGKAEAEDGERATVIIVDDEESSRLVNASLMRFLGYACDDVGSGEALLEQLKKQDYELILMDIMMPGVDGFEATRRIRNGDCGERNREAFIIAVTACAQEEDEERARKAGINAYLTKPLTIQALRETILRLNSVGHHI